MDEVPTFYMNASNLIQGDFDMYLSSKHDLFFRRIIEHVTNRIEGTEKEQLLCKIIDENEVETVKNIFSIFHCSSHQYILGKESCCRMGIF